MAIPPKEIVAKTRARAKVTERCSQAQRNYVHIKLLEEAVRGLDDVNAGKVVSATKLKARFDR